MEDLYLDDELREELGIVADDEEEAAADEVPEHQEQGPRTARKSKQRRRRQQHQHQHQQRLES